MRDDGQCRHDSQFRTFQKRGSNQNAVDKIVEGIADKDEQTGAAVIVGRGMCIVRFAMIMVAMPPEHQFFQNEKSQNAEEHGCRHFVRIAVLQGMRQDFKKSSPEQCSDGVGNQHIDALHAERHAHPGRRDNAENAPGKGNENDPGKSAHRLLLAGKRRGLYDGRRGKPDQGGHPPGHTIPAVRKEASGIGHGAEVTPIDRGESLGRQAQPC